MANTNQKGIATSLLRGVRRNTRRAVLGSVVAIRKNQADRPAPDFVIVGAQRCGTTSLFRALNQHPAMMPNVIKAKGIHYFDTSYHQNDEWYLAHFPTLAERENHAVKVGLNPIVGEASPYYLYHPAVAERMAQAIPNSKIVVLLRNPVKRAISHHLHMVWEGHESVENIDEALDMESSRLAGIEQRLLAEPEYVSRAHQHYSYMARGHYAHQLNNLYKHFDRENVLVMTTEKLISDSQSSLAAIQSFIGLEPDLSIGLEKRNASSKFEPKASTVQRLTEEFADSNRQLAGMVDIDIPW